MNDVASHFEHASIDRVRELVSIGAGHAAGALGKLLDTTCQMRVPQVRVLARSGVDAEFVSGSQLEDAAGMTGVLFEVQGGLGGVLALLFTPATRDALVTQLVGRPASEIEASVAESALRELGNILVSHVASAMADTLGVAVIPSVPILVMEDAPGALRDLVGPRMPDHAVVRLETEIADREGTIRSLLAFVPDHTTVIARPTF